MYGKLHYVIKKKLICFRLKYSQQTFTGSKSTMKHYKRCEISSKLTLKIPERRH